ncbi:hypothetical protein EK904_003414 [Melospiza melodia maxima]|nr:hypothetical protein EK904_003414 [Melospiza melodia maxima]
MNLNMYFLELLEKLDNMKEKSGFLPSLLSSFLTFNVLIDQKFKDKCTIKFPINFFNCLFFKSKTSQGLCCTKTTVSFMKMHIFKGGRSEKLLVREKKENIPFFLCQWKTLNSWKEDDFKADSGHSRVKQDEVMERKSDRNFSLQVPSAVVAIPLPVLQQPADEDRYQSPEFSGVLLIPPGSDFITVFTSSPKQERMHKGLFENLIEKQRWCHGLQWTFTCFSPLKENTDFSLTVSSENRTVDISWGPVLCFQEIFDMLPDSALFFLSPATSPLCEMHHKSLLGKKPSVEKNALKNTQFKKSIFFESDLYLISVLTFRLKKKKKKRKPSREIFKWSCRTNFYQNCPLGMSQTNIRPGQPLHRRQCRVHSAENLLSQNKPYFYFKNQLLSNASDKQKYFLV